VLAATINEILALPSIKGGPTAAEKAVVIKTVGDVTEQIHASAHNKLEWNSYELGDLKPGDVLLAKNGMQTLVPRRANGKYTFQGEQYDYEEFHRLVSNAHTGKINIHLITPLDVEDVKSSNEKPDELDAAAIEKAKEYVGKIAQHKFVYRGKVYKAGTPKCTETVAFIKSHKSDYQANASLDERKVARVVILTVAEGEQKGEAIAVALDAKNALLGVAD
jgi:hypothetical protein